jgi:hypothetical protein
VGPSAPIQAVALKPLPVVPDAALLELEPPFSANICKLCWNEEKLVALPIDSQTGGPDPAHSRPGRQNHSQLRKGSALRDVPPW